MKKVMLICDCCKLPVPAIKSVDLCQPHLDALGAMRKEREPRNKPVARVLPKRTQKGIARSPWNKADYGVINPKIMELADTRPMFTGQDVVKAVGVKQHIAKIAIQQLIREGKIESTGKGAGRKLSKAS